MKVYLSARFGRRLEMREVALAMRLAGHTVVSTWHDSNDDDDDVNAPDAGDKAYQDLREIREADLFVAFTDGADGRGGRHAEFGYALAKCRAAVVVGPVEQHFHRLWHVQHAATVDELLGMLGGAT